MFNCRFLCCTEFIFFVFLIFHNIIERNATSVNSRFKLIDKKLLVLMKLKFYHNNMVDQPTDINRKKLILACAYTYIGAISWQRARCIAIQSPTGYNSTAVRSVLSGRNMSIAIIVIFFSAACNLIVWVATDCRHGAVI